MIRSDRRFLARNWLQSAESAFGPMLIGAAEVTRISRRRSLKFVSSDLSSRLRWSEPVDRDCNRLIRGCVSWALMG